MSDFERLWLFLFDFFFADFPSKITLKVGIIYLCQYNRYLKNPKSFDLSPHLKGVKLLLQDIIQ